MQTILNKVIGSELTKTLYARYWPMVEKRISARGLKRIASKATFTYTDIVEDGDSSPMLYDLPDTESDMGENFIETPRLKDVWSEHGDFIKKTFQPVHQKKIGTCGIWTIQNIVNQFCAKLGIEPFRIGVSLLYKNYRADPRSGNDTGTAMDSIFAKLTSTGVPIKTWPDIFDRDELAELDRNTIIDNGESLKVPVFKKQYPTKYGVSLDYMQMDLAKYDPDNHVVQISLDIYRPNKKTQAKGYWHNWLITHEDETYLSGRHSIVMFYGKIDGETICVLEDNGEKGVIIIDSGDGEIKFLKDSYVKKARMNYRVLELNKEGSSIIEPNDILETTNIRMGDSGAAVVALQKHLEDEGVFTHKGAKGYFGGVTRTAMVKWQIKRLGRSYGGEYWGSISQQMYKTLKGQ